MIVIDGLEQLPLAARRFAEEMGQDRIFAFSGPMGAGKTTFIKALCQHLGVADNVCSPTFALVNPYLDAQGRTIFHFDFYRLDEPAEALGFGLHEYFDGESLCLMEWPEKVAGLLPEETVWIDLDLRDDGRRTLARRRP